MEIENIINGFDGLRNSWETIVKEKSYPIYAIFLCTDIDKAAIEYIDQYWQDLNELSAKDCLIFIFKKHVQRTLNSYDIDKLYDVTFIFSQKTMAYEAYQVARLLNVNYSDIPCLVFFESLDSRDIGIYSLKNMSKDEIAFELRSLFDRIRENHSFEDLKIYLKRRKITLKVINIGSKVLTILEKLKAFKL